MHILRAGFAYWALIFGLGFVLGTVRVLWLAPLVGETAAGLVEMPFMLGASWWVAGWLVARCAITRERDGLAMGALAFALLMVAELALGVTLFELDARAWASELFRMPGVLGLAGQVVFALMPWLVLRFTRRTP